MEAGKSAQTEKRAIETLLDDGVYFEVERRGLFARFFKGTKKILITQPYLGTLDYLTKEYLSINFDEKKLQENPLSESKRLTAENTRRMARIVAIAVLNSKWKIKLLTGYLSGYFLWRLTPSKLYNLCVLINAISNVTDFTNSIRLTSGMRTTAPKADLIEQKAGD